MGEITQADIAAWAAAASQALRKLGFKGLLGVAGGVVALSAARALYVSMGREPSKDELARRLQLQMKSRPADKGDSKGGEGDVKVLLKLSTTEAARGCEKQVTFNASVRGQHVQRTATLVVPSGVTDGHVIRIKGLGNTPKSVGQQGDLVLEILIEEDEDEE